MLCLGAGCDDYICKPVKQDDLLAKICKHLQRAESFENIKHGSEICSELAGNPDYIKAIEMFVANLPERISQMKQALDTGNLQELAQKAHALKGLGGFAGFPIYTQKAKDLENFIQSNKMDDVKRQLDELVELCGRTKTPCTRPDEDILGN